jgi:AraC family transcriptional regulator
MARRDIGHSDEHNPIWRFPGYQIETTRSWGPFSVDVVSRAAGEAVWRSDHHRISYVLSDVSGAGRYDDGPVQNCHILRNTLLFTPSNTEARWDLSTSIRKIQILQSHATYDHLISEMVWGGTVHFHPGEISNDPLVSKILLTIANEVRTGFLDRILADALSTALAVRIVRRFVDPSKITLAPSNGLSRERLQRVRDHIEANLDDGLTLADLAGVACLSTYHFSRSFKQAVGVGPRRYVMQRRVERAKTLIRRSNQPLALIAQEVGFTDQSHLTCFFRRETGTNTRPISRRVVIDQMDIWRSQYDAIISAEIE